VKVGFSLKSAERNAFDKIFDDAHPFKDGYAVVEFGKYPDT
jgi:hypothetical protein